MTECNWQMLLRTKAQNCGKTAAEIAHESGVELSKVASLLSEGGELSIEDGPRLANAVGFDEFQWALYLVKRAAEPNPHFAIWTAWAGVEGSLSVALYRKTHTPLKTNDPLLLLRELEELKAVDSRVAESIRQLQGEYQECRDQPTSATSDSAMRFVARAWQACQPLWP